MTGVVTAFEDFFEDSLLLRDDSFLTLGLLV